MIMQLTSEILFRCPCCQKLYCTDSEVFNTSPMDDSLSSVEFDCTACEETFFLLKNLTSQGLYQTQNKQQYQFLSCPKCEVLRPESEDECPGCGVLVSKYQDIIKLENSSLYEIQKKWNTLLTGFSDDEKHQDFLNLAQSKNALSYAHKLYSDLTLTMGMDPLTEKYLNQIQLRLNHSMNREAERKANLPPSFSFRSEGHKIVNAKAIFMVMSLLSAGFFVFNVLKPQFPRINSFLIIFLALSVGLWILARGERA